MKVPPETRPIILGAVGGAFALALVGFAWGGWVTSATAEKMAKDQSNLAVVKALAPICAENFQQQPDAVANLTALKATSSYKQTAFIEEGGWDVMVGSEKGFSGTAKACAELLNALPKE